jgi:hypothetical protein
LVRFAGHGEICLAMDACAAPFAPNITAAVTISAAAKCRRHAAGELHLKFEANSILSNFAKIRVAFASIFGKTCPSSPTAASALSATV